MLNVQQLSECILPPKDLHLEGPVEAHVKLLRWHCPEPAKERTHMQTNLDRCLNLSGLHDATQLAIFIDLLSHIKKQMNFFQLQG